MNGAGPVDKLGMEETFSNAKTKMHQKNKFVRQREN
jgi:hypothetical protein